MKNLLMKQCGKAEVNLGPLLILIGAAMAATDGEIADFAEMLFEDLEEEE